MKRVGTALLLGVLTVGCSPATGSFQSGAPRMANALAGASSSVEKTRREVRESATAAEAAEQQKREEYKRQLQVQLDKLNEEVRELSDRAAKAGADARVRLDRRIADLKARQADVQRQWESFKAAAPGAWDEMKGGLDRALGELRRSYDRAAAEFNK